MTKRRRRLSSQNGFTLTEAMFGLVISVVIGGAVWSLLRDFDSTSSVISGTLAAQYEENRVLKTFSAELRTASPSSLGAYALAETSATSITFFSDANKDGIKEQIRYFLQNGELRRGSITPTGSPLVYNPANEVVSTVVRDVANGGTAVFSYYDTGYDGTTPALAQPVDVQSVRLIKMDLIIDKNGARAPAPTSFSTQISVRNLKDNT